MHHLWKTCPFVLGVTLAFLESPYDSVTSTGARGSHDYCPHSAILPRTERAKTGDQRTAYAATSRLAGDVSGYGASCQRDLDQIVSIRAYQIALTRLVAPSAAESLRVRRRPLAAWDRGRETIELARPNTTKTTPRTAERPALCTCNDYDGYMNHIDGVWEWTKALGPLRKRRRNSARLLTWRKHVGRRLFRNDAATCGYLEKIRSQ